MLLMAHEARHARSAPPACSCSLMLPAWAAPTAGGCRRSDRRESWVGAIGAAAHEKPPDWHRAMTAAACGPLGTIALSASKGLIGSRSCWNAWLICWSRRVGSGWGSRRYRASDDLATQPCIGICIWRPLDWVEARAFEKERARALRDIELERSLFGLLTRLANVRPRDDEWERNALAFQAQARHIVGS